MRLILLVLILLVTVGHADAKGHARSRKGSSGLALRYLKPRLVTARWYYACKEAHQKAGPLLRVWYRPLAETGNSKALESRFRWVRRRNGSAGRW